MDKIKVLRSIVKKLYPEVSFITRIKKNGDYQIIFRNIKDFKYSEEYKRAVIQLMTDKIIPIDTFYHNIQGFFPFLTKTNIEIKLILWNGKSVILTD